MNCSLDKLAANLQLCDLTITSRRAQNDVDLALLQRKGVYPYEYLDSYEQFDTVVLL